MNVWGRVAADLELEPDLHRIGRPRPRQAFVGRHRGCRVTLVFDTLSGAVRGSVASSRDTVLTGEDSLRVVERAGLHGWPSGVHTGDADFDERVAVLAAKPDEILLRLDVPTRSLLAEMLELGVWITDDQVLIEPRATAAMGTLAEAMQLIDSAVDLLKALRASTPEQLIEMAFGDPSAAQRGRAWSRVKRMVGRETRWAKPMLDAIERNRPPEGPALLARVEPSVYTFDQWLRVLDLYPTEGGTALLRGWPVADELARGPEIIDRVARCLVDPSRRAPPRDALAENPKVFGRLLDALRLRPDVLWTMADWPFADEARHIELLAALATHDAPRVAERLAATTPETTDGELAWVAAAQSLPGPSTVQLLAGFSPKTRGGQRSLFTALQQHEGTATDIALLAWTQQATSLVAEVQPQVFVDVARRIAEALDVAPDGALLERCDTQLPPPLTRALTTALVACRPRHGAGWLARHAPDWRGSDPEREAGLLGILGELGDPAGQARCIAALGGSDFLRIAAARALASCGTALALQPLDALTGFFAPSEVKAAAKAAIEAIRERETRGPRGGLTVSEAAPGGGLSVDEG